MPPDLPETGPLPADRPPTWQMSYPVALPGGIVFVGFQCTNMPTDGLVAMEVTEPIPSNSFVLPPVPIMLPDARMSVVLFWPACPEGTNMLTYWQGATPPPAGAAILPTVAVPGSPQGADRAPDWQMTWPVAGPGGAGPIHVGVEWENVPTDGVISFSFDPPGFGIGPIPVHTPRFTMVFPNELPANYQGEMTLTYWQGAQDPARPGAKVTPILVLPSGPVRLEDVPIGGCGAS